MFYTSRGHQTHTTHHIHHGFEPVCILCISSSEFTQKKKTNTTLSSSCQKRTKLRMRKYDMRKEYIEEIIFRYDSFDSSHVRRMYCTIHQVFASCYKSSEFLSLHDKYFRILNTCEAVAFPSKFETVIDLYIYHRSLVSKQMELIENEVFGVRFAMIFH